MIRKLNLVLTTVALAACAYVKPSSTPSKSASVPGSGPATVATRATSGTDTVGAQGAVNDHPEMPSTGIVAAPKPTITKPTRASAQAKPAPSRARAPAVAMPGIAAVPAKSPSTAPALDLAALKQRLRDTSAIGLFTKLSLKNQVDDLLDALRGYHSGRTNPTIADLRLRYDLLLVKVLTLLQDGDPPLAAAISTSKEPLWSMLADPDKFRRLELS